MRIFCSLLAAVGVGLAAVAAAQAEQTFSEREIRTRGGSVLREARSHDGRLLLRVSPGRAGDERGCRAVLLERGADAGERVRWESRLVNEYGPVYALIRDDGAFVVTLDEFRRGGARHAVVVYDDRGRMLRDFDLRELLGAEDWREVRRRGRMLDWLSGATFTFTESPQEFHIRTRWERTIRIGLTTLKAASEGGGEGGDGGVPEDLLDALEGPDGEDEIAERMSDALARLLEQQSSPPTEMEEIVAHVLATELAEREARLSGDAEALAQAEELADAAREVERALLQRMAEQEEAVIETVETLAADAADALLDAPHEAEAEIENEPAPVEEIAPPRAPELPPSDYEPMGPAGISADAGVAVPMPDPRERVDYLAWAGAQTQMDGPNAWADYNQALDVLKPYEGNPDLLDRALAGDALALESADVQDWLRSNLEALQHLSAGNVRDARGFPLESEDGTLIGVVLPPLRGMRELAQATIAAGRMMEAEGSFEGAADFYLDVLSAGANVGSGVTMIESLVGVSMQSLGAEAMLDLYGREAAEGLDYAAIADDLEAAYRPLRPVHELVQFERAMALDTIQSLYRYDESTGRYRLADGSIERIGMIESFGTEPVAGAGLLGPIASVAMLGGKGFESLVNETNAMYDAMTDALRRPYTEARDHLKELEAAVSDPGYAAQNPLLAQMLPAMSRYNFMATRAEATRRATSAVAQIHAYRQRHGAYPESLEALGARNGLIDPFTGRPFLYARDGDEFVLRSAGDPAERGGDELVFWPRPRKER